LVYETDSEEDTEINMQKTDDTWTWPCTPVFHRFTGGLCGGNMELP
jgi:hypothetical protein